MSAMSAMSARPPAAGRVLRATLLLASLVAGTLIAPSPAAAGEPTFGRATATATFGESIEVEQPATLSEAALRVEAVVRAGVDARTFLAEIPDPGVGSTTLRYEYETPFGSLFPNTEVELGFRLTFEDGRVVDSPTTTVRYEDDRFAWRTLQGPLVRVHWAQGDDAFGRRALDIGEQAVEDATALLGVEETERIDFFVYGDQEAFRDVLGPALQENVGGVALNEIRTMFANIATRAGERRVGGHRDPARAHAPGVRHGHEEPVPRAAALAERGPRGLPRPGLWLRGSRVRRGRGAGRASSCPSAGSSRGSRAPPSASASPTTRACPRSTTSSARTARTRS